MSEKSEVLATSRARFVPCLTLESCCPGFQIRSQKTNVERRCCRTFLLVSSHQPRPVYKLTATFSVFPGYTLLMPELTFGSRYSRSIDFTGAYGLRLGLDAASSEGTKCNDRHNNALCISKPKKLSMHTPIRKQQR